MNADNTAEKIERAQPIVIILIIILSLTGLIGSLLVINRHILPYEGQRAYIVTPPSANSSVYLVDSFRIAKKNILDTAWVNDVDSIHNTREDSLLARVKRFESKQITLNHNPSLLVWMISMAMMVATALGLFIPLLVQITRLILTYKPRAWTIVITLLLTIGTGIAIAASSKGNSAPLMSAFEIIDEFHVLLESSSIMIKMINVTLGTGVIAIFGMFLVNLCISKIKTFDSKDPEKLSGMFHFLNNSMRFFLISISILILYSVITTALIQQSIDGVIKVKQFPLFPSQFIYAYGLMFTIFLAIIYLPIHYHLRMEGQRITRVLTTLYKDTANEESLKKFDMHEPTMKSVQVFLAILAPVLGSVFTEMLKHVSQ